MLEHWEQTMKKLSMEKYTALHLSFINQSSPGSGRLFNEDLVENIRDFLFILQVQHDPELYWKLDAPIQEHKRLTSFELLLKYTRKCWEPQSLRQHQCLGGTLRNHYIQRNY